MSQNPNIFRWVQYTFLFQRQIAKIYVLNYIRVSIFQEIFG